MTLRFWHFLGLGLTLILDGQGCQRHSALAHEHAVELVPRKIDLGTITQNETSRANVELHNRGAATVRPRSRSSTSRCRWEALPDTLAPRSAVPLSVACKTDLLGPLQEELPLLDATQADAAVTLRVVAQVEPIIGFDTAFVDLRPEFGQIKTADVRLIGRRAEHASPLVSSTGGDVMTVTTLAADVGRAQGFRASCRGERVGMHAGSMVIETGIAEQPTLTLSWGCRVPGTLEVVPSNPYFNLRVSGDRATTIAVRSNQSGFFVKSARVVEGPFVATLQQPNADGITPITIRVKNDEIPDEARAATGKLLIESNDAREPHKEVPLFGFGKVNKVDISRAAAQ